MMNSSIPDSVDCLNLAGILPYDAKAFIKDGTQVSINPQIRDVKKMMSGVTSEDSFIKNKKTKKDNVKEKKHISGKKLAKSFLGASLLFAAVVLAKKKFPKFDNLTNLIDENTKKAAEFVFKKGKEIISPLYQKIKTVFTK